MAGPHLIGNSRWMRQVQAGIPSVHDRKSHYFVPANDKTVHWGYFSKSLKPLVQMDSGDFVTIEALTHHANDDAERMIKGDPGAESVFYWSKRGRESIAGARGRCNRLCPRPGRG